MLEPLLARLAGRPPSPYFTHTPRPASPRKRYLIATTPRTGSTFLCSRIGEFGALGYPMEFLNETYIGEFDRIFPSPSLSDYEGFVAATFSSPDKVFGLKADWWQFYEAQRLGFAGGLVSPLDLIVYLRRNDIVAQAVSLVLASETHVWHAREVFQDDLSTLHTGIEYDQGRIIAAAQRLLDEEFYWREFFKRSATPIVELAYEQLSQDIDTAVHEIAASLGVDLEPTAPSAQAITQTTSRVGAAWIERFHAERPDFTRFWTQNRGLMTATPPA